MSKESSWEEVELELFIGKQSNLADHLPLAWEKFSTTTSIKDYIRNILRDTKEILLRWRKYFEDLLNPVRATPTETCDNIDYGQKEVFTWTAAIRGLESEKAARTVEIRLEMLKALNGEACWLTGVC